MSALDKSTSRLDDRIAALSVHGIKIDSNPALSNLPLPLLKNLPLPLLKIVPVSTIEPETAIEKRLAIAREELIARLGAEVRLERRSLLSRGDFAKIIDAAVQAYFVRHAIDANLLARRDLVTDIMRTLLTPADADTDTGRRSDQHKATIAAAKAQIQPLVLEHMDVGAAAAMPRPAFEAQLTG
jgi:hypothetical protein